MSRRNNHKYRCQIEEDLWTMRRNYMIRKREQEFRDTMKHPYLYVIKNVGNDVPGIYRDLWRGFVKSVKGFWEYPSPWRIRNIGECFLAAAVVPFLTLYAIAQSKKLLLKNHEEDMKDLDVEYPWEFEGVWGDPDLKDEVVLGLEEEDEYEESYSYLEA